MSNTTPSWYPMKPGELYYTPVKLPSGKIVPAHELREGQVGFLAVDLATDDGPAKPTTLDAALMMVDLEPSGLIGKRRSKR